MHSFLYFCTTFRYIHTRTAHTNTNMKKTTIIILMTMAALMMRAENAIKDTLNVELAADTTEWIIPAEMLPMQITYFPDSVMGALPTIQYYKGNDTIAIDSVSYYFAKCRMEYRYTIRKSAATGDSLRFDIQNFQSGRLLVMPTIPEQPKVDTITAIYLQSYEGWTVLNDDHDSIHLLLTYEPASMARPRVSYTIPEGSDQIEITDQGTAQTGLMFRRKANATGGTAIVRASLRTNYQIYGEISLTIEAKVSTAISTNHQAEKTIKQIRNQQIIIIRNGKTYDIYGRKID